MTKKCRPRKHLICEDLSDILRLVGKRTKIVPISVNPENNVRALTRAWIEDPLRDGLKVYCTKTSTTEHIICNIKRTVRKLVSSSENDSGVRDLEFHLPLPRPPQTSPKEKPYTTHPKRPPTESNFLITSTFPQGQIPWADPIHDPREGLTPRTGIWPRTRVLKNTHLKVSLHRTDTTTVTHPTRIRQNVTYVVRESCQGPSSNTSKSIPTPRTTVTCDPHNGPDRFQSGGYTGWTQRKWWHCLFTITWSRVIVYTKTIFGWTWN